MKLENYTQLEECVNSAEYVLVGLGEEWTISYEEMIQNAKESNGTLAKVLEDVFSNSEFESDYSYYERFFYKNVMNGKISKAYEHLSALLEGKNYFVVSLTLDDYLKQIGLDPEHIVNPCGNYDLLQCMCQESELKIADHLFEEADSILNTYINSDDQFSQEKNIEIIQKIHAIIEGMICTECNSRYVFNSVVAKGYREDGYLANWKKYMDWLIKTVNRNLCVIELGVGMQFPSVIRWPFEKTTLYNQKSTMFRVHQSFSQANQELAERTYSCQKNAIDFMSEKNV